MSCRARCMTVGFLVMAGLLVWLCGAVPCARALTGLATDGALGVPVDRTAPGELALPWATESGVMHQSLGSTADGTSGVVVPFTSLAVNGERGELMLDLRTVMASVELGDGRKFAFPKAGIPVKLLGPTQAGLLAVFRTFPENKLELASFVDEHTGATFLPVAAGGNGYLIYRAAVIEGGQLFLVVYDNRERQNRILRYAMNGPHPLVVEQEVVLPSLEDPAGRTYEMEPAVFLLAGLGGSIRVLGGTLDGTLVPTGEFLAGRRSECVRIIEAVRTGSGVSTLCDLKAPGPAAGFRVMDDRGVVRDIGVTDGIPWNLRKAPEGEGVVWSLARTASERRELFRFDLERGQNSGLLELGSNNVEGRIAWAQIYYLNGLLDLLLLVGEDQSAFETFGPLAGAVRTRLDVEFALLEKLLGSPVGYHSRAFTVGREPALFAVQTGRLLGLLERRASELRGAAPSAHLEEWRTRVFGLVDHMEVVETGGEPPRWVTPGRRYLAWPRGSAFPFDGVAVPYNHQNEWAWSVFETARRSGEWKVHPAVEVAKEVIRHFVEHVLPGGRFPADGRWPYWWGRAMEGWTEADGVSTNTRAYPGDRLMAWISFRTIDVFGVLAALEFLPDLPRHRILDSAAQLVREGLVYPCVAGPLMRYGRVPGWSAETAARFSRAVSPWELANSPWVLGRVGEGG